MSRTLETIYDELIAEKESLSELNGLTPVGTASFSELLATLTSTSTAAVWRLWLWIVAFAVWTHESLWDLAKEELAAVEASLHPGTARWYHLKALAYQHGDSLTWDGDAYVYDPVDLTARVVEVASVTVSGGVVRVKVSKLDGDDLPTPLSAAEETGFESYMDEIKIAGTPLLVINLEPDKFKFYGKVVYDPAVLAPDGSLLSDPSSYPVHDAVNSYLAGLPFDGLFRTNHLVDAMQAVDGVIDPIVTTISAAIGAGAYSVIIDEYVPAAGSLKVDAAFPLSTTLTYEAG